MTAKGYNAIIVLMMKSIRTIAIFLSVLGMLVSPRALAQDALMQPTDETAIDRLQANCGNIQATLGRLHTSDSLLRVNIGHAYSNISSQLMARLNSRLALNQIDSSRFTEITDRFNKERQSLTTKYGAYESKLSSLLRSDCNNRPGNFYETLLSTSEARRSLAEVVDGLNAMLDEYQVAVESLQHQMSGSGEVENEVLND